MPHANNLVDLDGCPHKSNPKSSRRLLIVGASARAAANSARSAGLVPLAADRFGDQDLRQVAAAVAVMRDVPRQAVTACQSLPAAPWIYTGPLENHPEVIHQLSITRPLFGNGASVVRRVRDPFELSRVWKRANLLAPATCAEEPGDSTAWLSKPFRSAGGGGIYLHRRPPETAGRSGRFFQQFIPGKPVAAVYLAAAGHALLLGVTNQIVGADWCGSRPFQYCGSVGPATLSADERGELERIGDALAAEFKMCGLFGVDAILHQGRCWPIEVNPRYTASVEVIEQWRGPLLSYHVAACVSDRLPSLTDKEWNGGSFGKAVVFAKRDGQVPSGEPLRSHGIKLADVPHPDLPFQAGQPVLTVFASAADPITVEEHLRAAVADVRLGLGC